MTLSPQDQARIISQESAWVDSAFGGIDLSAFPDLNSPPPEDRHDDRFAKHWSDTPFSASAAALQEFVANPDTESLERVGEETGNSHLLADVRDQRGERASMEFKRRCPGYLPTDDNYRSLVVTLAYNALPSSEQDADVEELADKLMAGGHWTAANLEACYLALNREGLLDVPIGEPRPLSERERLRVARLAQAGRVDEAIGEYLRCALDGDEPDMAMIHDPKYRGLCSDACYEVFQNIQLDYVETASRKAFLLRFAGNRPLTIPLLQQAWKSCQANEARRERGEILGQISQPKQPQPIDAAQIDELSDKDVDQLFHASLQEYARTVGRGSGVIA